MASKKARRARALGKLSRDVSALNARCLKELWDNGDKQVRNWVKDHISLVPRIVSARVIVYRDDDPLKVYLRETSSGRYGILGGSIEVERDGTLEDALACAIREAGEEGEFLDLKKKKTELVTLVGKDSMRVSSRKAVLRGLIQRRSAKGRRVKINNPSVLMYATPTKECFKKRVVKEAGRKPRDVVCINLRRYFGKNSYLNPRHDLRPSHINVLESWYWFHQNSEDVPAAMLVNSDILEQLLY